MGRQLLNNRTEAINICQSDPAGGGKFCDFGGKNIGNRTRFLSFCIHFKTFVVKTLGILNKFIEKSDFFCFFCKKTQGILNKKFKQSHFLHFFH